MAKYLESGTREGLERAEAAFTRSLELNPDLPMAHKLYAQLEVDLGRASDAMARLMERAPSADPELFAGLVSACRYCGLLEASVAADAKARRFDARIRTSIPHTWFLLGDHRRVAAIKIEEYPYIVAISLAELGRGEEAIPALRELEKQAPTRLRDFAATARALIEGDKAQSMAAASRIATSDFQDPEGLFYLARHVAHVGESHQAIDLLRRVVAGGFFCYPAMARDPWLDPLRKKPGFTDLLRQAEARHREAISTFGRLNGSALLDVALPV